MPSPFPGMNPYLEREYVWKDFHDTLLFLMRRHIVAQVRPHYYVKIGEYLFIHEPPSEERRLLGHADVSVSTPKVRSSNGMATALASPSMIQLPVADMEEHIFLEIRDRDSHNLVTVVELLSPTNKRPSPDRDHYLAKRAALIHGSAHFVEIDLLRGWPKMPMTPEPECDYCVIVSRLEDRPDANFWPIMLRETLPTIPIPLQSPHVDATVDLQALLHAAYDEASYQDYLYDGTPMPPLNAEDAAWANSLLQQISTKE